MCFRAVCDGGQAVLGQDMAGEEAGEEVGERGEEYTQLYGEQPEKT